MKRGEVLFVSKDTIEIKTKSGREEYRLSPSTIYIKRGHSIELNQIREGDRALLFFDSIYTDEASTIRIEDEEKHISGVLKGKIEMVDTINREMWIKTPFEYKNGGWIKKLQYSIKLKSRGENLYNGNKEISLDRLKNLRGREVYIAYDSSYGGYNIAKLRVKNGFSNHYDGKVFTIEYNTGQMVVSNNLIGFDASTIVIKDNRLVDSLNIDRGRSISLVGERNGKRNTSSIVTMDKDILEERMDGTNIYVYRGKLEDIFEHQIEIGKLNYRKNYLKLEKNKWREKESNIKFFYSWDTLVYDSGLKREIDPIYLSDSRFIHLQSIKDKEIRDRIKNNYYRGKQAYFVTREDEYGSELLALNLTPYKHYYGGNVALNHSVQGRIGEIDYEDKKLTINKVKSYNNLNSTWETSADEVIDISKGIVLLNDKAISLEDIYNIKIGSKVNIIKEKTSSIDEGYVIFVED